MGIALPLVFNYFGNYYPGVSSYVILGLVCWFILGVSAGILWLMKSNKQLRALGVEKVVKPQQPVEENEEKKLLQEIEATGF